jgi:glycine cleavage system transcriptional repressor
VPHVAVTAFGADRPGIVAAVTQVFVDRGCNLEDTSMTVLRGHFAMMFVADAPAGLTPGELERALAEPAAALDLVVSVRPLEEEVPHAPSGDAWTISVYGVDRPGIVHRVTGLLAEEGVNIVDLTTRVVDDAARPAYAMLLEVTVPPAIDTRRLRARLTELARDLGIECSLQASEAEIL